MSKPRQILPGQFYLITRRCTQRQYLLRPDDATNNAFIYCPAVAALRFGIDIVLPLAESNHHHTVIFDRYGRCPAFVEHFHKLLARSQNVLRGRRENLWSAEEPCITLLIDRAAVIEKLIYVATNPVKDRLVERAHHWPGVTGYPALCNGGALRARRPLHFFRPNGPMPETVTLQLVIPPELGAPDEVIAELRAGVESVEQRAATERRRTGGRIVGRRNVLAQSWKDAPTSDEPRRNLRPRFAGSADARIAALIAYKEFLAEYRDARTDWLAGRRTQFPTGTYWLARFTSAPVASIAN